MALFPQRPIRIYTGQTGGVHDVVARLIAGEMTATLGQQIIVDNQTEEIAIQRVLAAEPDGYALLIAGPPLWIAPLIHDLGYDPVRDFSAITLATISPLVVLVHPSVPAQSLEDLLALAKSRPQQLKYAMASPGGSSHLATKLLELMTEIEMQSVPCKNSGAAINALIAGDAQLMIPSAGAGMPHVKAGKLRALAVTSSTPSVLVPAVPPVARTIPGYEAAQIMGIFAPGKTPPEVVQKLNGAMVRALKTPSVNQQLLQAGIEPIGSTPDELARKIEEEIVRVGKIIKNGGIAG